MTIFKLYCLLLFVLTQGSLQAFIYPNKLKNGHLDIYRNKLKSWFLASRASQPFQLPYSPLLSNRGFAQERLTPTENSGRSYSQNSNSSTCFGIYQNKLKSWFLAYIQKRTKDTIFIYDDAGVSEESLMQIERTIKKVIPAEIYIVRINAKKVIEGKWQNKALLFILPGGADLPYVAALNGIGNQRIRTYVEQGGSFLGICAGSYYAGNFVEFAPGTALEVRGTRELAFFPGTVSGPILAPYDYLTNSGARVAKLRWNVTEQFSRGTLLTMFYNGGGTFVHAEKYPGITVLAYYDACCSPAIIECTIGQGRAILSGPHFEYDPTLLNVDDHYLQALFPELVQGERFRVDLLKYLLSRLISSRI